MPHAISILGCGPAGAAAAIAAIQEGAGARIIEKSKLPRHKVCGEFFSPEIAAELEPLGAWDAFLAAGPAPVRRIRLHFGTREKTCVLPEQAWGLSRYTFDALLAKRAQSMGAQICDTCESSPDVLASGRRASETQRGRRLFGFKAHFEGPADDAVELFFFDRCYVGVNTVEGGRTNVCGLGPEAFLRRFHFDFDHVVRQSPALAARLNPLRRSMKWVTTGPLQYGQAFGGNAQYLAGDALSFVDPFTGSGLVAAVKTGALAGRAAAINMPVARYSAECRAILQKSFEVAGLFRRMVNRGWAEWLIGLVPGRLLFSLTRPK